MFLLPLFICWITSYCVCLQRLRFLRSTNFANVADAAEVARILKRKEKAEVTSGSFGRLSAAPGAKRSAAQILYAPLLPYNWNCSKNESKIAAQYKLQRGSSKLRTEMNMNKFSSSNFLRQMLSIHFGDLMRANELTCQSRIAYISICRPGLGIQLL